MGKRPVEPIVSAERLAERLAGAGGLTVIDTRFEEDYAAGHIPGALSVPFGLVSAWSDCTEELLLELPPQEALMKTIGDCGLTAESQVVVVGRLPVPPEPPYPLADPLRVAATLLYAGIKNVAVLSGGQAKWVAEGRETTTEVPAITARPYTSPVDSSSWVSTQYVKSRIGKALLLDGRDPEFYFGAAVEPFADRHGHIPSARSLPLVWVWEPDGCYKPLDAIEQMAAGVAGTDKDREIICYCGAGGYASGWWFLLTQAFGYRDVKIYDGSMEAWVDGGNPLTRYTWD